MLDMTINKTEKENFIIGLKLNLQQNIFTVKYADGKEEKKVFTIEEFNKSLLSMEKQFLLFKDTYIDKLKKEKIKLSIAQLVELMIAITGVAITCNLDIMTDVQSFIIILTSFFSVCFQSEMGTKISMHNYDLYTTYITDEFIKHKEDFKVEIVDQKTNEKAEWYIVNLANIWKISSKKELEDASLPKNIEIKTQKLVKKLNKALNKNYML